LNKILYFAIFAVLLIPIIANSSALQEVAGKVILQLSPGETQHFNWGLLSDSNTTITVSLSAGGGNGSQFLSYPKSVTLQPKQTTYVDVSATIPSNYAGPSLLHLFMFATQAGQQGGMTVINTQVGKVVTLNITAAPAPQPQTPAPITQPSTSTPSAQPQATTPEFPSIAGVIFAVATMSAIILMVSKRSHNLFKF
jgi:predicted secreted protein with PEFG-CTERM motif